MTTLSQMAVSLAFDLDLHKDVYSSSSRQGRYNQRTTQSGHQTRTLEERRTILALFHVTSS